MDDAAPREKLRHPEPPAFSLHQTAPEHCVIHLAGSWTIHTDPPDAATALAGLAPHIRSLAFLCEHLEAWDTRFLVFLKPILTAAGRRHIEISLDGLPAGAQRLLQLSAAVPEAVTYDQTGRPPLVTRLGLLSLRTIEQGRELAAFTGEIMLECLAMMRGRLPFRGGDLLYFIQCCGVESLPIVTLIAMLVGVILSFVGAVQLQMFGAQIYVANLVGLGMVLEMGALMSGVIIAGRIGAAYAAQLGTMQVNEEIDALRTMGISPVGFLVLPRMFALMFMLPLLCVYADIMGILGGSVIGVTMLDLSLVEFLGQARKSIQLGQFGQGILKSSVFGVLIGYAGCLRGMQCGRSALAVGEATTSAVVTSIVLIVISDSIITFLLYR